LNCCEKTAIYLFYHYPYPSMLGACPDKKNEIAEVKGKIGKIWMTNFRVAFFFLAFSYNV